MKKEPLKIKADDLKLNFHVDLHDANLSQTINDPKTNIQ